MAKPRKEQLHGANLKLWNFKGTNDFLDFAPTDVLSNDVWFCNADTNVSLDSGLLIIRPGDMVLALIDQPGSLTRANVTAGKWSVIKHFTDDEVNWIEEMMYTGPPATINGQSLRYSEELTVSFGWNYNTTTKRLSLGTTIQSGDNVNIYVNGLKYSHVGSDNAFTIEAGLTYVVWIPTNCGFDLGNGDYIEVEIFNKE